VSNASRKTAIDYTDGHWHRLHPLTPVLQGGLFVAAIIGVALATFWDVLLTQVTALIVFQELPDDPATDLPPLPPFSQLLVFLGVGFVAVLVGVLWLWLSWFLHTFRITDDVIEVRSGIFVRTYRKARRDRINSVSIWRQLVPRLLGLAKVEFQAAGSDANVTLSYLPDDVSKGLRRMVLDTSPLVNTTPPSREGVEGVSEVRHYESDDFDLFSAEDGDVRVLVPLGRLAWSLVFSLETVMFLAVMGIITGGFIATEDRSWWLAAIPALVLYLAGIFRSWTRANRFRLAVVGDSIRVSYGLLSTTAETLPPRRVHSVTLSQPWPWRLFGWWRIHARRAVTPGQSSKGPSHTMLLPVGRIDDAMSVIDLFVHQWVRESGKEVIPDALNTAVDRVRSDGLDRFLAIHAHPLARLRLLLSQQVHSMGIVNDSVWMRTGFLIRRLTIVPLERIQSSGTFRGPWHLMLGLTGVDTHLVSGPGLSRMVGFGTAQANAFSAELSHAIIDAVGHARSRDLVEGNSL
jgi:putative membrane protein